jgi:hypothetical protein
MQEFRRMKNARFLSSLEFVGSEGSKNQILANVIPTGKLSVSLHIKAVAHDAGTHSTECYTLDGRGPLKKCKQATNLHSHLFYLSQVCERLVRNCAQSFSSIWAKLTDTDPYRMP